MSKSINESKIDILLMSDNGLETVGGEQESTKIIINGVKDKYSLGVVQPGEIKYPISNVKYYYLTPKTRLKHLIKNPVAFLAYIWKIKKIINRENPKIIHTQAQVSFFIVALLTKMRLVSKSIQLIHTERGLYTKYSDFIRQIFLFFIKELDTLVATTNFNMKYWKAAVEKKGYAVKFKVIENTAGKLFETYNPKNNNGFNNKSLKLGFAGRYCDWKNWPLAVEISRNLNEQLGKELSVKMAVGCLDEQSKIETEKMFDELKGIFGERFEGKINIDMEAMDRFYYDIDIFVLTSNYNTESFGRTLVEAMSRGTVVLTTDAGGSVEVVDNLSNVWATAEEFTDRIIYFYQNKKLMASEKKRNLTRVREKYSLSNNINKHLNLYSYKIKID